jgi:glutaredoxin
VLKKSIVITVVLILLISSAYIWFTLEPEKSKKTKPDDTDDDKQQDQNKTDNQQNVDNDSEYKRIVFVEEGTSTTCKACPQVGGVLHELFNPENPEFYYVSLVEDENTQARNRLSQDYNFIGLPTVYIDGGYKVIFGAGNFESVFEDKLASAFSRNVPKIIINIESVWNETRRELNNTVFVENLENSTYAGNLKVYISEIVSPWKDYDKEPYNYALIDYSYNDIIEIDAFGNGTFSKIWNASSAGFKNVYPENLWVIAVLFNSEKKQGFSDPDDVDRNDDKREFDAYYADNADATRVTEGKTPPSIGIKQPKIGTKYLLGNEKRSTLLGYTFLIGKTPIKVSISAESGVEKVEFIISGRRGTTTETIKDDPYEFVWNKRAFGKHTITVKVYDKDGRIDTDSMEVYAFIFGILR